MKYFEINKMLLLKNIFINSLSLELEIYLIGKDNR